MKALAARYYDGRSTTAYEVTAEFASDGPGRLRISLSGPGLESPVECRAVELPAAVPGTVALLDLPGGGSLEIRDGEALRALHGMAGARGALLVAWLESHWGTAIAALAICAAAAWFTVVVLVPRLADRAVARVPWSIDEDIGRAGLEGLDRQFFHPSALTAERRRRVTATFDDVARELGFEHPVRVEFRAGGPLGANAFALPGHLVVVTDELVEIARTDDELRAVYAHELGHVARRHAMRTLLRGSANATLLILLLGDVSTASSLAASVPAALVEAANSREQELEADRVAADWMRSAGVSPSCMQALLRRIESRYGTDGWSYFSSHPPSDRRFRE